MAISLTLPIRIVQLLLAIVVLSLSAYVANWYHSATITIPPPEIGFLVAISVLSLLSLAYLEAAPRFAPKATHPYAALAVETVNTLFYLAGFIAQAAFLGRLRFCRGSVCNAARADAGLAAGAFVAWAATMGLTVREVMRSSRGQTTGEVATKEVE